MSIAHDQLATVLAIFEGLGYDTYIGAPNREATYTAKTAFGFMSNDILEPEDFMQAERGIELTIQLVWSGSTREALRDDIESAIGSIVQDSTLGGTCDFAQLQEGIPVNLTGDPQVLSEFVVQTRTEAGQSAVIPAADYDPPPGSRANREVYALLRNAILNRWQTIPSPPVALAAVAPSHHNRDYGIPDNHVRIQIRMSPNEASFDANRQLSDYTIEVEQQWHVPSSITETQAMLIMNEVTEWITDVSKIQEVLNVYVLTFPTLPSGEIMERVGLVLVHTTSMVASIKV